MEEDVLDAPAAWVVYDTWRGDGRVAFMTEPPGLSARWRQASSRIVRSPNAWTDAYLAAFAQEVQAAVVTFDRRFPLQGYHKVEILSPP
jgi:uncharacterized protein